MYITAILLAAGKGQRFKSRIPKPLVKLGEYPIINYSLKVLNRHSLVKDIILVVNSANEKAMLALVKKSCCKKISCLVLGGARRQDSVFNALKKVNAASDLVLIHDSARPFVKAEEISVLITRAKRFGAAILGVPVKATIKEGTRLSAGNTQAKCCLFVKETLKRENLWEIQTPQVFDHDLIIRAYQRFGRIDVTDDAALIEKLGKRVVLVSGSSDNIKITAPGDLIIAEAILRSKAQSMIKTYREIYE